MLVTDSVAHTHVRARHWLAGDSWTVYGHYVVGMADGQIAALTLQALVLIVLPRAGATKLAFTLSGQPSQAPSARGMSCARVAALRC